MHKHIICTIHIYIYIYSNQTETKKAHASTEKKTRLHVGHICLVSSPNFSYKYTVLEMDATITAMSFILDSRLSDDEIVQLFRGSPVFLATETIPANLSPTFEAFFIDCQFSWYNSSNYYPNWVCLTIEDN